MAVENSPIQNCGLQIFVAEFHAEFTCYVIRNTLHHIEIKCLQYLIYCAILNPRPGGE